MVTVSEATSIILSHPFLPKTEQASLEDLVGRVLAQSVFADRDFPPFDRVVMDGIAIRTSDFNRGTRAFTIGGLLAAGQPALPLSGHDTCIEVMTGAVVPPGADAVARYEDIDIADGIATVRLESLLPGNFIHAKGVDARSGSELLSAGAMISAAEVALIASVGLSRADVYAFPRMAIVSTGDELVAVDETPLPYQIRRSNAHALHAAIRRIGGTASLFAVTDQLPALEAALPRIIEQHDLIILSGGVSKGKFDHIPRVLEACGIRKHFHQVSQRPGKPLWFGSSDRKTVFALPGNPVSTYMCFYRYIQPWLRKSFGTIHQFGSAVLAEDVAFKPPLTYFLQVKVKNKNGTMTAYPDAGGGSGDFANLKDVDGFLELPLERDLFRAGESFPYIPFR